MHEIAVSVLSENPERLAQMQQRVEATHLGRVVIAQGSFPAGPSDAAIRRIQETRTEVVVVDIAPRDTARAMQAIELIHANVPQIAVFAAGAMNDPSVIVAAMRSGAREYLERESGTDAFIDALRRFSSSRSIAHGATGRARWRRASSWRSPASAAPRPSG